MVSSTSGVKDERDFLTVDYVSESIVVFQVFSGIKVDSKNNYDF